MPIDIICNTCGGSNVARDAWASWDTVTQDWVLGAVFDHAFCHDCAMETSLVECDIIPGDRQLG